MPASKYDYVAIIQFHGLEKTITAPSIRQLSKDLNVSHVTLTKVLKRPHEKTLLPIQIFQRQKENNLKQ